MLQLPSSLPKMRRAGIRLKREIGRETVQYDSNVYKYYLAYTLVAEQRGRARQARERLEKK